MSKASNKNSGYSPAFRSYHVDKDIVEDLNPENTRKFEEPGNPHKIKDYLACWGLFTTPSLLCALHSAWSPAILLSFGVLILAAGHHWNQRCKSRTRLVREAPILCGFYTSVSAILSVFIPIPVLLLGAILAATLLIHCMKRSQ